MKPGEYFSRFLSLVILVLAGASLLYQSCAQNPEMTNFEEKKVSEGVCPRCRSGNVGKWEYGLVDNRLNDSTFVDKISLIFSANSEPAARE